ncbi:uncharacterized protein LOC127837963 isoform X1 [Dreissena polymorpha]|uniref:Uncharacterized protein n=1 Tax=Dreissena polymorpha TaxID=45954 RepID=A0A9D4FNL4_DREPO|nr:uncharacterized protein LOC127837963 isoform X1 [Dreissena polymorpha]KAH3802148.1 hypothetical protein DPMN_155819 [Dreissena polymorpha]
MSNNPTLDILTDIHQFIKPLPQMQNAERNDSPLPKMQNAERNDSPFPQMQNTENNDSPLPQNAERNDSPLPKMQNSERNYSSLPQMQNAENNDSRLPQMRNAERNDSPLSKMQNGGKNDPPLPHVQKADKNYQPLPKMHNGDKNYPPLPQIQNGDNEDSKVDEADDAKSQMIVEVPVRYLDVVVSVGCGYSNYVKQSTPDPHWPDLSDMIRHPQKTYRLLTETKRFFKSLLEQVSISYGQPTHRARAFCKLMNVPFYRFSPLLSENVPLDCVDEKRIERMLQDTHSYIEDPKNQQRIKELAARLKRF